MTPALRGEWNDDLSGAVLFDEDGLAGFLRADHWWEPGARQPTLAWIVGYMDPNEEIAYQLQAAIECPARAADTPERRKELVAQAAVAIATRPPDPEPPTEPAPEGDRATRSHRLIEMLITAWDQGHSRFREASALDLDEIGEYQRFVALSELLLWTYVLDETLAAAWENLDVRSQMKASNEADERARRAIDHNRKGPLPFDEKTNPAFEAFRARQEDRSRRPYEHWASPLLAGRFTREFFLGLRWVRGEMHHRGATSAIEIRQWRAGVEPRWKWKAPEKIAARKDRKDKKGRAAYQHLFAGGDVLGDFSFLIDIFVEASWMLFRLMREEAEAESGEEAAAAH